MKLDITSMFFNSKIEGASATAAWGTSIAKQNPPCTLYETAEINNVLSGMLFSAKTDKENLDISGMSDSRELVLFSVFDNLVVNGKRLNNASFILLLVREHSVSHDGRLLLSYPMYATYRTEEGNIISNSETKDKIAEFIGCSTDGCWFVYDITIENQDTLHISTQIVNPNQPQIYKGTSKDRSQIWKQLVEGNSVNKGDLLAILNGNKWPMQDSEQSLEEQFAFYLRSCAKSTRHNTSEYLYTESAVTSILSYMKPQLMFEYNLEKWKHITSMYAISEPKVASNICEELLKDKDFNEFDKKKGQWASVALMNYCCFLNAREYFHNQFVAEDDNSKHLQAGTITDLPLQQIYYGAPGTGKSFGVDEVIKKNHYKAVRTTFHPDSDYSTFVGCYKPQMETVTVRDDRGFPVKENGQVVCKKEIVYKYSPQAFLKAYVEAWKDTNSPQVLVIEEINRGNCAQIFGDIFQLLDRNKFGYSSYPIIADQDIMMHLNEKFSGLNIANADEIDAMYEEAVTEDVLNGSKLILPKNLYIWATMNTSDQSLFPIDSAFKRRWDWKYVRISEGRDKNTGALIKNTIKIDDSHSYDWWEFLEAINNAIGDATNSEDKKLGFFFCKAKDNVINAELFVAKVIFYLWNDVFKDSDTDLFQVLEDGNQPTFDQFYTEDTMGNTIVNTNVVVKFIEKVMKGVE